MADNGRQPQERTKGRRRIRDVPEWIKWILLVLLLLLLGAVWTGPFNRADGRGLPWIILILILILIGLLLVLIRVQRDLKCALITPKGCTEEQPDPVSGKMVVKVTGTATGIMFGSYELEVRKVTFASPIPNIVSYPGGGSSGSVPVIGGELGRINTTSLMDGAYEVRLVVYPIGPGSPKSCTSLFHLLKAVVYIGRIDGLPALSMTPVPNNPNPFDPAAEIGGAAPVSVGGGVSMEGSAYIYECEDRRIKQYEIRYARVTAPGAEPAQPATGAPIPATWPVADRAVLFEYTNPDMYQPWTRVGIAPANLINTWKSMTISGTTFYKLNGGTWNSGAAGSGRFSLLLTAEDTAGHRYHDIQHLWIDNKPITGQIVKFQWFDPQTGTWRDIPPCTDLSMKRFGKIRIMGLAWDPLIDDSVPFWPPVKPNDNFDHYALHYAKQFAPWVLLKTSTDRVPVLPAAVPAVLPMPTPTAADAGELAVWDLTMLAALPVGDPNRLGPGESCTYILQLYVTDTTVVGVGHHETWHQVPVKVVNDL